MTEHKHKWRYRNDGVSECACGAVMIPLLDGHATIEGKQEDIEELMEQLQTFRNKKSVNKT